MSSTARAGARVSTGSSATPAPSSSPVPILRTGDCLTADEFRRRYEAMPWLKKAELIDGVVFIPSRDIPPPPGSQNPVASPVSYTWHGQPHIDLATWVGFYKAHTPGTGAGDNATIRLDLDNEPQPDVCLLIEPSHGGQVRIDDRGYLIGAPDLVAEVAYTSVNMDLNKKFETYRRHQAREYLVVRTEDGAIDWFVNHEGRFDRIGPGPDGILRSVVFPGLWLDAAALLRGDLAAVLAALRLGLETAEHAAFRNLLADAAKTS
jgi:Uma2 family endonuclease